MDSVTNVIQLTKMKQGQQGEITEILGGINMQQRLENMGIILNKQIKVVSIQMLRGPIIIKIDQNQIALGHGISEKVMIKPS